MYLTSNSCLAKTLARNALSEPTQYDGSTSDPALNGRSFLAPPRNGGLLHDSHPSQFAKRPDVVALHFLSIFLVVLSDTYTLVVYPFGYWGRRVSLFVASLSGCGGTCSCSASHKALTLLGQSQALTESPGVWNNRVVGRKPLVENLGSNTKTYPQIE